MSPTTKKGVQGGIAAVVAVVIITTVGFTTAGSPGKVVESGPLIYVGWVSALTFLGCLVVTKYYDSIPDETPVHTLFWASILVGIPAFASGQLLPTVRPFTKLTVAVSLSLFGGIVTMWVFLYVFDWKHDVNPYLTPGDLSR